MKIYNAIGGVTLLLYVLACMYFAPASIGPWAGVLVGAAYFITWWFIGGLYLSPVIHLGIAHRSLDYKPWFIKTITVVNNTFGVYINPVTWVNRHRLHHRFADHPGDPNKLASDGVWRTLYLCLFPYKCQANVATDEILKSWSFRLVSNWPFAVLAQVFNYCLLSLLVGDWIFGAVMWLGLRIFATWVNMVQNFWTHDRRFGYRRYDDELSNAMNIGEWLPVTATFSACLQNNHHHHPGLLRLSHTEAEYDFGFICVKLMKKMGLVQATFKGRDIPKEVPLAALDF